MTPEVRLFLNMVANIVTAIMAVLIVIKIY